MNIADGPRVLLVSMPWAGLSQPSIQLGVLKACLTEEAIACDTCHANVRFRVPTVHDAGVEKVLPNTNSRVKSLTYFSPGHSTLMEKSPVGLGMNCTSLAPVARRMKSNHPIRLTRSR